MEKRWRSAGRDLLISNLQDFNKCKEFFFLRAEFQTFLFCDKSLSTVTIEESIDECLHFIITENLDFNVQAKSDQKKKFIFVKIYDILHFPKLQFLFHKKTYPRKYG